MKSSAFPLIGCRRRREMLYFVVNIFKTGLREASFSRSHLPVNSGNTVDPRNKVALSQANGNHHSSSNSELGLTDPPFSDFSSFSDFSDFSDDCSCIHRCNPTQLDAFPYAAAISLTDSATASRNDTGSKTSASAPNESTLGSTSRGCETGTVSTATPSS